MHWEANSGDRREVSIPSADECVLRHLLDRWADETPNRTFLIIPEAGEWTYAQMRHEVRRAANALRDLGVEQGDMVLSWLPNGFDAIRTWFAANYLGAVYVPINTAYRGKLLEHVIANSGAKVMIGHADLVERLGEINLSQLRTVVLTREPDMDIRDLNLLGPSAMLSESAEPADPAAPIEPWHTQAVIYTSGTTGPSKGVLSSYIHIHETAGSEAFPYFSGDDRFIVTLPLFHVGGTALIFAMLMRGGSVALVSGFRTDEFWQLVDDLQATCVLLLGVMATFLLRAKPSPDDRSHSLKRALLLPLTEENSAFRERFGVDICTVFNMTETSTPLVSELNPENVLSCGKIRRGTEVRLVDENDIPVPPNTVGELVVRTHTPWALNHGYLNNAEATARAWRNGWFHTGDAFTYDEDGGFYFVDRIKDTIRRRGENVSSFEVESEIVMHPSVRETAVVAVPSELGEDDILAIVSPVEGESVDPAELTRFLIDRLPYFMVPRYVRVVSELPKTPTEKIKKVELREVGITPETWDRESDSSIVVKKEKLGA